ALDAGIHNRAAPPSATSWASRLAAAGPLAESTSAVNAFSDGPPSAMRKSGRLESRSSHPYLVPDGREQVAVTPARASPTINSLMSDRDPAGTTSGVMTSATPSATDTS